MAVITLCLKYEKKLIGSSGKVFLNIPIAKLDPRTQPRPALLYIILIGQRCFRLNIPRDRVMNYSRGAKMGTHIILAKRFLA